VNKPAKWSQYKKEFAWDGSWRDVYVLNTSIADWQALLELVKSSAYQCEFTIDGHPEPLPEDVRDILSCWWADHAPLLIFEIGGIPLYCHFFSEDEIEFDLDPRDMTQEEKAGALFEFMKSLSLALGLRVRMTPENMREEPIFEYDPEAGVWSYHSYYEDGDIN